MCGTALLVRICILRDGSFPSLTLKIVEHSRYLPPFKQHMTRCRRYEFTKASDPINMEEIVEALAHHPILSLWMKEIPG
jgi:hypothetical protein